MCLRNSKILWNCTEIDLRRSIRKDGLKYYLLTTAHYEKEKGEDF